MRPVSTKTPIHSIIYSLLNTIYLAFNFFSSELTKIGVLAASSTMTPSSPWSYLSLSQYSLSSSWSSLWPNFSAQRAYRTRTVTNAQIRLRTKRRKKLVKRIIMTKSEPNYIIIKFHCIWEPIVNSDQSGEFFFTPFSVAKCRAWKEKEWHKKRVYPLAQIIQLEKSAFSNSPKFVLRTFLHEPTQENNCETPELVMGLGLG